MPFILILLLPFLPYIETPFWIINSQSYLCSFQIGTQRRRRWRHRQLANWFKRWKKEAVNQQTAAKKLLRPPPPLFNCLEKLPTAITTGHWKNNFVWYANANGQNEFEWMTTSQMDAWNEWNGWHPSSSSQHNTCFPINTKYFSPFGHNGHTNAVHTFE